MVPVGFRVVGADAETLGAERVEDLFDDVRLRIGVERAGGVGRAVIRLLRVEQAETVVVLRREDDVLHARVLGGGHPFARVELLRVEGLVEGDVIAEEPSEVLAPLGPGRQIVRPGPLVRLDQRPRLDAAPLAVDAPVHHEAELPVLELVELVPHERIGLLVGGRLSGRGRIGEVIREDVTEDLLALGIGVDGVALEGAQVPSRVSNVLGPGGLHVQKRRPDLAGQLLQALAVIVVAAADRIFIEPLIVLRGSVEPKAPVMSRMSGCEAA